MVTVIPSPPTGWRVDLGTGEQPFVFPVKAQAIAFALAWAGSRQPTEVRVYGAFGELERSVTVPDGNYRRPPRTDRRRNQLDIPFRDRRQQDRRARA
jgi:hypothetical protein